MNAKVIAIGILTIIALVILTLFSFGPLSNLRKQANVNPASIKSQGTEQVALDNKPLQLGSYHNKDTAENYYMVKLPQDWQTKSGQSPGSYTFSYSGGTGTVELQDVSDNTTLELFILSQQEPLFKKTLTSYIRKDYKKLTVNGNEVYELVFDHTDNGHVIETTKAYVTGSDHAVVLTFNSNLDAASQLSSIFGIIINSFQWENK